MILTTKEPKQNKERVQEWRERNFKHKASQDSALEKVREHLGWYEPVEQ